jgi:hypothetical protein
VQTGDSEDSQHSRLRVAEHHPDTALTSSAMRSDQHTEPGDVESDNCGRIH